MTVEVGGAGVAGPAGAPRRAAERVRGWPTGSRGGKVDQRGLFPVLGRLADERARYATRLCSITAGSGISDFSNRLCGLALACAVGNRADIMLQRL